MEQEDSKVLSLYTPLIFPSHLDKLKSSFLESSEFLSFVAEDKGAVIGLALAEYCSAKNSATLHSIMVPQKHRRKGIASALLVELSRHLALQGCHTIEASYTSRLKAKESFEALLRSNGWSSPWKRILFCRGIIKRIEAEAAWVKRARKTSKGFSMFSWSELSSEERSDLQAGIDSGDIPFELSPFYKEDLIQWETSVGLRYHDRVVGWQVNHTVPELPATIRYSRTFVEERFQRLGRAITLMSESVYRHCEHVESDFPYFLSDVAYQREAMVRFYERHLCPHSESVYSSFGAKKQLQNLDE
jgi:GNAT superfamily N-acetyltransferase